MTDTVLTVDEVMDKVTHLKNLVQQLDDCDIDQAIRLIQVLLEWRHGMIEEGPVRQMVLVQRPTRRLDD